MAGARAPQSKRRKTLESEAGSDPIESTPLEPGNPNPPESCAICYSDDGKSIRGQIDCCDHFFCFLCIMEWSKTESRCPLCRRRFATIHRPPKAGVFVRSRTVKVPVRDQVYKPFLEQVRCTVCSLSTDESLLMLCDGCDAAAHTFCVGFGRSVPEGDWFCGNCDPDDDSDDEDVILPGPLMMRIPPIRNQSAGVMADVTTPATTTTTLPSIENRLAESVANQSSRSPSDDAVSRRLTILMEGVSRPGRTLPSVENRPTESVARTVDRCRNVQSRIQTLRDNWNGFRCGSLSFPSSSVKSACSSSQRPTNGVVIHETSSSQQTQSSSSTSRQQLENQESSTSLDVDKAWRMMEKSRQLAQEKSSSAVLLSNRPSCIANTLKKQTNVDSCFGRSSQAESSSSACVQRQTNQVGCASHDVDRAWKIMDTMSKQHIHPKTSSSVQQPKLLSRKASGLEKIANVNLSFDVCERQQHGARDVERTVREGYKCDSRGKETISYQSLKLEKERRYRVRTPGAVESGEYLSTSNSQGVSESQRSGGILKQASEGIIPEQSGSACFISEGASSSFIAKPHICASSSSKLGLEERNVQGAGSCVESKAGNFDEAKSEIISRVKTNLKLLSKDKPLGVDAFKEIARRSTHTILAACGFEHPKPGWPSFPSVACCHTEQLHLRHKSSLMPKSCQDCFSSFVKDVVSSILLRSAQLK